jgi:hypothetical protein
MIERGKNFALPLQRENLRVVKKVVVLELPTTDLPSHDLPTWGADFFFYIAFSFTLIGGIYII